MSDRGDHHAIANLSAIRTTAVVVSAALGAAPQAAMMAAAIRRLFTAGAAVIVVMSVSVGARASGAFMDGNDLYGFCASSGNFQTCSNYIEALDDAIRNSPIYAYTACESPSITVGQAVGIVKRYLATHPEQRHKPAWSLVMVALAEAFPCR